MSELGFTDAVWFKSSYSGQGGDECVEVAFEDGSVGVRDTKDRVGGHFVLKGVGWRAFLESVAEGLTD